MSEGTDTRKNPTREIAHAPGVIDARESAIIRRRSAVIVGARVRSLGLAALLSMTSGCGGSGLSVSTGSSDTVPSWPPAGPTVGGDAPRETVESAAHRTPLVFTRPVPGIAVREGEAHGIGYLEVVLGETDTEARLPMMFLIHGRGDRPHIPGGPFSQLPYAMRVIMPRAPALAGEGFSWLPVVVAEGRTELLATSLHEVADRLALVIEELRAERPTLGPTLVGGFSQGGLLSFTIAIEHPEIVGIALPLAGWLPPPLEPRTTATVHNPPIRALHGADDARIPAQPTVEGVEASSESPTASSTATPTSRWCAAPGGACSSPPAAWARPTRATAARAGRGSRPAARASSPTSSACPTSSPWCGPARRTGR